MHGQWRVLTRPDCTLCEEMLAELVELLGPLAAQVQVQDITDDLNLERRYGHRIPVLMIDDELVCACRLERSRLTGYLAV